MEDLFRIYLQNSLSLSVVGLVIMFFSLLLSHRYSAKCRYYMLLVIVAALVIPVRTQIRIVLPKALQLFASEHSGTLLHGVNGQYAAASTNITWDWWQTAKVLWIAGALSFLVWHIIHHLRFMAAVRRWSEDIDSPDIRKEFNDLKTQLGIKRRVDIRYCACVKTPMMVGLLKPIVLLPKMVFAQDELSFVIKHELMHYKRKDLWYKLLIMLALTIHWFNPVIQIMARSVLKLCEISCDEDVLKGADAKSRARYGETIIEVIRKGASRKTILSTSFYSGTKGVKERIYAIMDMKSKRFSLFTLIAVVVLAFCGTTAFALSSPAEQTAFNKKQVAEVSASPYKSSFVTESNVKSSEAAKSSVKKIDIEMDNNSAKKSTTITDEPRLNVNYDLTFNTSHKPNSLKSGSVKESNVQSSGAVKSSVKNRDIGTDINSSKNSTSVSDESRLIKGTVSKNSVDHTLQTDKTLHKGNSATDKWRLIAKTE